MKIYNIYEPQDWDFRTLLMKQTWAGARDKIQSMDEQEFNTLCNFLNEFIDDENGWSLTQVNDYIWFKWNDDYADFLKDKPF